MNNQADGRLLANYHTHTARCQHAWGEDKEYIEHAIQSGMQVLGISDHCPWVFPDDYISHTRMHLEEVDGYFQSFLDLKQEYKNDITIYIGFESEYIPELMEAQNQFLKDYPIDYMILGEHFTSNESTATYTGFPFKEKSELTKYVDLCIEAMETGKYTYVAHPDLFNFTGDNRFWHDEYFRLCQYLKSKNVPVEINLLGVAEGRHYTSDTFLEIVKEVGNSVIIGCDAHTPDRLDNHAYIQKCQELALAHDLTIVDVLPNLMPKT